ncbi:hypothetical protein PanWU01x14_023250 [Parasponia andersonii]|uniref:Uncharacterized protein n=1 Tax=Parasponia andersonii TaxID=3476 RepID=A0A2P5DXF5_PARAD|nr:hypothetical protein PanWU01x14_023250 [Parasponia andersonii]
MSQRCGAVGLLAAQLKSMTRWLKRMEANDPILFPWVTHPPTKAMVIALLVKAIRCVFYFFNPTFILVFFFS